MTDSAQQLPPVLSIPKDQPDALAPPDSSGLTGHGSTVAGNSVPRTAAAAAGVSRPRPAITVASATPEKKTSVTALDLPARNSSSPSTASHHPLAASESTPFSYPANARRLLSLSTPSSAPSAIAAAIAAAAATAIPVPITSAASAAFFANSTFNANNCTTTNSTTTTTTASSDSTSNTTSNTTSTSAPLSSSSTATSLATTLRPLSDQSTMITNSRPTSAAMEDYQGFGGYYGTGSLPTSPTSLSSSGSQRYTTMVHSNGYGFHDSIPASQRSSQEAGGFRHGDDDFTHMSFVYANEKRFSEFHSVFRSVPDSEKLIEDYGCALQKEILVQGRLYISENHVCFNANIFGWVTNLVIAFSEIIAIEKKMTAFVIPNAISIVTTTNTRGHFFASFLSRDAAHDLLMAAWRKAFPCAANASVGHGHGNGYRRDRSNMAYNDDDDSNDAQSFISTRGNSESRRNRHRRSFSNASQAWIGDDGANSKEEYWPDDDETPNTNTNTGSRRRTPKKAGVRKLLKDVIAPIVPDDEQRNPNTLSPTTNGTTNGKKGRGRSLSELAPRPTSFDMARDRRDSITSTRSSFDEDSLAPKSQPRTRSPSRRPTDPVQKSSRSPPPSAPSSPLPLAVMAATAAAAAAGSAGASRAAARGPPASAPAIRAPPASAPPAAGRQSPTTCKCSKDGRHYPNQYMSEVYPGTVQSMWKLLFDSDFNKNFLTSEVMKGGDVQEEAWQTSGGAMTKTTKYIKWLGMPIGPKTTKATLTDVCEHRDFDDYVTTVTATSTPDVPSGGCFTTKVRTCISWAGPNQVQIIVTGAVEFSKSTWIKGQIEKGAADGLTTHYKELNKFIRKHVAANSKNLGSGGSKAVNGAPVSLSADRRKERLQSASPANGGGLRSKELADTVPSTPVSSTGRSSSSSSSSSTDIWSMLAKATEWNHGAVSHLALVAVLVAVMLANAYIFRQIASVSTQIEKMQDGGALLTSDHSHHHHHHHQHQQRHSHYHQDHSSSSSSSSRERPLPPAGSGRVSSSEGMRYSREMNDFEREEMFAREQEEAMWAWLLEREARHRQYRAASGVPPPPQQQQQPSPPFSAGAPGSGSSSNTEQRSPPSPAQEEKEAFWSEKNTRDWILQQQEHRARETETRLQARIAELQERLAALEQQSSAIKVETRVMEEEQDQGIPI